MSDLNIVCIVEVVKFLMPSGNHLCDRLPRIKQLVYSRHRQYIHSIPDVIGVFTDYCFRLVVVPHPLGKVKINCRIKVPERNYVNTVRAGAEQLCYLNPHDTLINYWYLPSLSDKSTLVLNLKYNRLLVEHKIQNLEMQRGSGPSRVLDMRAFVYLLERTGPEEIGQVEWNFYSEV